MEPFVVVTHPVPIRLEARRIDGPDAAPDQIALGFFHGESMVARGAVPPSALAALDELLDKPVTLAIAATQDDAGNIDGRVCVVLPLPEEEPREAEEPAEPWKTSLPDLPPGIESQSDAAATESPVRLALLPLGNVVRSAANRHHEEIAGDAREMLANLLAGRGRDAVSRAIDDLLDSL